MPGYGPFDVIIADPPYGDTSLVWDKQVTGWEKIAAAALKPSGSLWLFGSLRSLMRVGDTLRAAGFRYAQDIVWEKHNGSAFHADRFKRVHEHVVQFYLAGQPWKNVYNDVQTTADATPRAVRRKKRPTHTGHIEASAYVSHDGGPRLMRSVIYMASCHGKAIHPTEKPVDLLKTLILTSCPAGGFVGDFFAGSGAVGEACYLTGRNYIGAEIDSAMAERANHRLKAVAGLSMKTQCCVVAETSLNPDCSIKLPLRSENLMQMTVTINPHPNVTPIAVQQWLDWGMRIEAGDSQAPAPGNGATKPVAATQQQKLFNQLVETRTEVTPPQVSGKIEVSQEIQGADETGETTETDQQPSRGAVPPGMEKRKGGRPPSAATLAKRAAEAAASGQSTEPAALPPPPTLIPPQQQTQNGAIPPGVNQGAQSSQSQQAVPPGVSQGARPPNMAPMQPAVQPQQPALPPPTEPAQAGTYSLEDVKAVYKAAVDHDPVAANGLLRAKTWPSGETKVPWFLVDKINSAFYDRLYSELAVLIPAEG